MNVIKTVKLKINSHSNVFKETLSVYRNALACIVEIVNNEWTDISNLMTAKDKNNYTEKLIHKTVENPSPQYTKFDNLFYKFPSYFRRAAIAESIGIVNSYQSNLENWKLKKHKFESDGKILKDLAPVLSYKHYSFPVFYKGNMFKKLNNNQAKIKIFYKNDWSWVIIDFDSRNLLKRDLESYKECNPSLIKKGKNFYLHIPFEKSVKFKNIKLKDTTIISVDLGLTNSAVCSAMKADGTIIDRVFINQSVEKDQMFHRLGRLKKAQIQSCQNSNNTLPNHWRKVNNLQKQIV
jgi:hypothetical protein